MEPLVEVVGRAYPFRQVLAKRYSLVFDRKNKRYVGRMGLDSPRLKHLISYAESVGLKVISDGQALSKKTNGSAVVDDWSMSEVPEYDDTELGKVGGKTIPSLSMKHGFQHIQVEENDSPGWKVDEWFEGTRFKTPRSEQEQVIPLVADAIEKGYKNIVISCPTGSGKSAISMMIPKMFDENAYITTHLKGLQLQYMNEMPFMRSVMGRSNYECKLDIAAGCRDGEMATLALEQALAGLTSSSGIGSHLAPCKTCVDDFKCSYKTPTKSIKGSSRTWVYDWGVDSSSLCDYFGALTEAQNARFFIGNNQYLMGLNSAAHILPQRTFLICDEAHNLASAMTNFYALDLSVRSIERLLGVPSFEEASKDDSVMAQRNRRLTPWTPSSVDEWGFPGVPSVLIDTPDRVREIGSQVWYYYLVALKEEVEKRIEDGKYNEKDLSYAYNFINRLSDIDLLMNKWKNWIWSKDDEDYPSFVTFKPIDIKDQSDGLLLGLGKHRIFLSATIPSIDIFTDELGLNRDETTFIEVKYSSFPVGNRPIITTIKGGKMGYSARNETSFIQTAQAISKIMDLHPDEKGLILPYTDAIEERVCEELSDFGSQYRNRLVRHGKHPQERNEVFADFNADDGGNDVLISTYANQGYDGKVCGFSIIVKLPFPALGDTRTRMKMKANDDWYKSETAAYLMQMMGRIVRSQTDTGVTYIIDPAFDFHYGKGFAGKPLKTFIPHYIDEAIL